MIYTNTHKVWKIGFNYKAKASQTKIVDEEELVKAKEVMGDKKYRSQEFEVIGLPTLKAQSMGMS